MRILHVVPGLEEPWNGIAGAAKDIARSQGADVVDTRRFVSGLRPSADLSAYDEIWVHSNWLWSTLKACRMVLRAGVPLVRMTHANLDPMRYRSKWCKKAPVAWYERWLYRRTARVVVTCEAERDWCERWGVRGPFEVLDLRRFYRFDKPVVMPSKTGAEPLHLLYLGRRHPLKGVAYLERAVDDLNRGAADSPGVGRTRFELKCVSNVSGDALEEVWRWADFLVLPTLSENFGRVVAEALERGKPVVTTDGAPVWADLTPERGVYLKGYRDGSDAQRVRLLRDALKRIAAWSAPVAD